MIWTLRVDFALLVVRALLTALALGLIAYGWRLRRSGRGRKLRRLRVVALGVLATLVFASAYGFFTWRHPGGVQTHDFYHYYLNAKYFPELGYFDLYKCTAAARAEEGRGPQQVRMRELRSFLERTIIDTAALGARCDEAFSPERWQAFRADLRWFDSVFIGGQWKKVLKDQGYNASPVWTLVGRPLASVFPAENGSMRVLARLDLLIVLVSFAFIGWAFGFEVLCIAALVWAANPLSRYFWIGDAFLRYAWFGAFVIGICLLRKQRHFGAGVLLALATLLRLFPALFVVAYGAGALRRWLRGDGFGHGFREFALGVAIATLVLPLLAIPVCGRGTDVWTEFAANIGRWSSITPSNSVGLPALLSLTSRVREQERVSDGAIRNQAQLQESRDEVFAERRPVYVVVVVLFLVFLWKALERVEGWEAACLGFVPILILVDVPAYYASFMVAPALLGEGRPRIGIAALAAMIGLCLATLIWWNEPFHWAVASPILLLVALDALLEMQRRRNPWR
ncbi:MAG: hypothetical protein OEM05_11050 [Myxococcales bacterium]|nr:hypothetical protein [Myxococcales bacterium]